MTLRYGIDISRHNETLLRKIDWAVVNRDKRLEYCFVKNGEPGINYPVATYRKQYDGARGRGMLPLPYWFYRYHSSANNQVVDFYNRTTGGYRGQPALDFEDETVQPTKSLAKNIVLAKQINQHLRVCVNRTADLFKVSPIAYSGAWWWNWLAQLVDISWINDCTLWVANYVVFPGDPWDVGDTQPILPIGWNRWDIWQIGSTTLNGFPTAVDLNVWKGDLPRYVHILPPPLPE